eukprot:PhM_4_TR388/c5_g1_i11/m.106756
MYRKRGVDFRECHFGKNQKHVEEENNIITLLSSQSLSHDKGRSGTEGPEEQHLQYHHHRNSILSATSFLSASSQYSHSSISFGAMKRNNIHIRPEHGSPAAAEAIPTEGIVIMLGLGLRHACLNNVSADPPAKDTPHACYISLRPIAIGDYLRRFDKFAQCSDECYAVAAVLLDRWCAATGVQLHRSIVHKLTLTALVVALKMYDDQQYPMDWYAQVGGVETPELMALERRFLRTIAWRVVVGHDEYVQYVAMMRRALDSPFVSRQMALVGLGPTSSPLSSVVLPPLGSRASTPTPTCKMDMLSRCRTSLYPSLHSVVLSVPI